MKTDFISSLLRMRKKINVFVFFRFARGIGSHLMSVQLLMIGFHKLHVSAQTSFHHLILLAVLEVVGSIRWLSHLRPRTWCIVIFRWVTYNFVGSFLPDVLGLFLLVLTFFCVYESPSFCYLEEFGLLIHTFIVKPLFIYLFIILVKKQKHH